jgi:hypothetical protein
MKIVVGMATFKGREEVIKRTIDSLLPQVDDIHIYNNELEPIDLTDNGKFRALQLYSKPIYFLSCDDDLIYPRDYVQRAIESVEKHECIISFHGRKLLGLDRSYYRAHKAYACLHSFHQTCEIDVPGTGVTCFSTSYFNPIELYKSEDKRMSDLVFGLEAAKQGKKIMHIGHEGKWIRQQDIPIEQTIYGMENKKAHRQMEIANEIYRMKYGGSI